MSELLHVPVPYWVALGAAVLGGGAVGVGAWVRQLRGREGRPSGGVPPQFRLFTRDGV